MLVIPGVADVLEVAREAADGRDLADAFRRGDRQQRGGAIDAGMREPRLGRRDQPAGVLRAALLRELADDVRRRFVPRQGDGAGGKSFGPGDRGTTAAAFRLGLRLGWSVARWRIGVTGGSVCGSGAASG